MWRINVFIISMLYQATLYHTLWCYAAEHAVWLKNRLPTSALPFGDLPGVIPWEAYHGAKPNIRDLRVFGCATYSLNRSRKSSTFDARSTDEQVLVGMEGSKVYKLLNPSTLKETRSVDMKFNEYRFPSITIVENSAQDAIRESTTVIVPIQDASRGENTGPSKPSIERPGKSPAKEPPILENSSIPVEEPPVEESTAPVEEIATDNRTRSSRRVKKVVFSDSVMLTATSLQANLGGISPESTTSQLEFLTVQQAFQEDAPGWRESVLKELKALQKTGTFKVVKRPLNRDPITCKWVLRNKPIGPNLTKKKARVVARGFQQREGIDYFNTFASVLRSSTLRILLAKATSEDLEIDHMDVVTAFLNTPLSEEIYMEAPELFELLYPDVDLSSKCLLLLKSLYGLKQAPRVWFQAVCQFFREINLLPSTSDPNLFIGMGVFLLLVVDDILIISKRDDVELIKSKIRSKWVCEDLTTAKTFVGVQIERNRRRRTLKIHQFEYARKVVKRYGFTENSNSTTTLLPPNTVLHKKEEMIASLPPRELKELTRDEHLLYQQIIGSVLFLADKTRLDISFTVGQLARHMSNPLVYHLRYSKQVLRYITGTLNHGITYSTKPSNILPPHLTSPTSRFTLYSDATWGSEGDRRSFQGWVAIRASGAISWSANRQKSTSQSTMEAEFMAANDASKEAAWLEKVTLDLSENDGEEPPTLFVDNSAAIELIHNHKFHTKAKHIDIRVNYIRNDMVEKGRLVVKYIPGENQPTDLLTKQLPVPRLQKLLVTMGILEAS